MRTVWLVQLSGGQGAAYAVPTRASVVATAHLIRPCLRLLR